MKKRNLPPAVLSNKHDDVVRALGYWIVLDDMSSFFKSANMPLISQHLMLACQEIDKMWMELETT